MDVKIFLIFQDSRHLRHPQHQAEGGLRLAVADLRPRRAAARGDAEGGRDGLVRVSQDGPRQSCPSQRVLLREHLCPLHAPVSVLVQERLLSAVRRPRRPHHPPVRPAGRQGDEGDEGGTEGADLEGETERFELSDWSSLTVMVSQCHNNKPYILSVPI